MSMFLVIATGIALGFLGNRWDEAWLWTSIGILILLWVLMSLLGTKYYDRVRRGVGAASFYGGEKAKALPPVSTEELEALLRSSRPILLSVIGLVGIGLILWLMLFKPF